MLEKDIQKAIMEVLELSGFLVVKINNVGIFKQDTGSYIPPRQKGIADLLVCAPDGKFIAIEIKTPTGQVTAHQSAFLEAVRGRHGLAYIMRSSDDAIQLVENYRRH